MDRRCRLAELTGSRAWEDGLAAALLAAGGLACAAALVADASLGRTPLAPAQPAGAQLQSSTWRLSLSVDCSATAMLVEH